MSRAILSLPNTSPWRGAQLKHRDNFTFYLFTFNNRLGFFQHRAVFRIAKCVCGGRGVSLGLYPTHIAT
jgi:hypothetical protein